MSRGFFLRKGILVGVLFCCLIVARLASAKVVINEVMFDPEGTDTGNEWVELFNNSSTEAISMTGWQLYPDGIGYFTFPAGFTLSPQSYVVIYLRTAGTNDAESFYHYESVSSNMGNTSGSVAIFSSTSHSKDTMVSFVEYGREGETWESTASDAGLWQKGNFVDLTMSQEGKSIALFPNGNEGFANWKILLPTKGAANSQSSTEVASQSTTQNTSSSSVAAIPTATDSSSLHISAEAGSDKTVLVGEEAVFQGQAFGFSGEPLAAARYLWNFGDGATQEGRSVTHRFLFGGTYLATLNISSGDQSASDGLTVGVVTPHVSLSEYLPGPKGWVELFNPDEKNLDISGWRFSDGNATFIFPEHSLLPPASFTVFANSLLGLKPFRMLTLSLKSNAKMSSLVLPSNIPSGSSVIQGEGGSVALSRFPTPGAKNMLTKIDLSVPFSEKHIAEVKSSIPVITPPATTTLAINEPASSQPDASQLQSLPRKQAAAVSDSWGRQWFSSSWLWLIIAVGFGFASGVGFLFLKKRNGL